MDKSIYDMAVDSLVKRQNDTRKVLEKRFRKTQPFRTDKVRIPPETPITEVPL